MTQPDPPPSSASEPGEPKPPALDETAPPTEAGEERSGGGGAGPGPLSASTVDETLPHSGVPTPTFGADNPSADRLIGGAAPLPTPGSAGSLSASTVDETLPLPGGPELGALSASTTDETLPHPGAVEPPSLAASTVDETLPLPVESAAVPAGAAAGPAAAAPTGAAAPPAATPASPDETVAPLPASDGSGQGAPPIAIISDIHGNRVALEVVLEHIASQGISSIYCLGDIIGYGPEPVPCLEKAFDWQISLLGNHEEAVLNGSFGMNPHAREAIDWTRDQLQAGGSSAQIKQRWEFLREMPLMYSEDDLLFVHGSPRDPTVEYVLRSDTEDLFGEVPDKIRSIFSLVPHICFIGHTHAPGIITEESQFLAPHEFGMRFCFEPDQRYVVNVGSVGQPRDGDNRACYVTFDRASEQLQYHRLEYDFGATAQLIRDTPQLGDRNAERLEKGC